MALRGASHNQSLLAEATAEELLTATAPTGSDCRLPSARVSATKFASSIKELCGKSTSV